LIKNGKPLKVSGDDISDPSGRHVSRRHGDTVYGPDGKHAGTVVENPPDLTILIMFLVSMSITTP